MNPDTDFDPTLDRRPQPLVQRLRSDWNWIFFAIGAVVFLTTATVVWSAASGWSWPGSPLRPLPVVSYPRQPVVTLTWDDVGPASPPSLRPWVTAPAPVSGESLSLSSLGDMILSVQDFLGLSPSPSPWLTPVPPPTATLSATAGVTTASPSPTPTSRPQTGGSSATAAPPGNTDAPGNTDVPLDTPPPPGRTPAPTQSPPSSTPPPPTSTPWPPTSTPPPPAVSPQPTEPPPANTPPGQVKTPKPTHTPKPKPTHKPTKTPKP